MQNRLVTASIALAACAIALAAYAQTSRPALSREAARGAVAGRQGSSVLLDTNPCGTPNIVVFRAPFTSQAAGVTQCGTQAKPLVQMVQG